MHCRNVRSVSFVSSGEIIRNERSIIGQRITTFIALKKLHYTPIHSFFNLRLHILTNHKKINIQTQQQCNIHPRRDGGRAAKKYPNPFVCFLCLQMNFARTFGLTARGAPNSTTSRTSPPSRTAARFCGQEDEAGSRKIYNCMLFP